MNVRSTRLHAMSRKTIYHPHNFPLFAGLALILFLVIVWLLIGVIGTAFAKVGFSPTIVAVILIATFLGSNVNIPIFKLKTVVPIVREEFVSFFGMVYRVPKVEYGERTTLVAVNLGGALIPTTISFYLLWEMPAAITYAAIAVAIVALVNHAFARPAKGGRNNHTRLRFAHSCRTRRLSSSL